MARYTGPVCKLCRREKTKLFLKGTRCESPEVPDREGPATSRRARARPGARERVPAPAAREAEGQALLRTSREAVPRLLHRGCPHPRESRARSSCASVSLVSTTSSTGPGLAMNRSMGRQLVTHGHFQVNGRKVNIPSYRVKPGDVVEVRGRSRNIGRIIENTSYAAGRMIPEWLTSDLKELRVEVRALPERDSDRCSGPGAAHRRVLLEIKMYGDISSAGGALGGRAIACTI